MTEDLVLLKTFSNEVRFEVKIHSDRFEMNLSMFSERVSEVGTFPLEITFFSILQNYRKSEVGVSGDLGKEKRVY